jgi:hypothetical protein
MVRGPGFRMMVGNTPSHFLEAAGRGSSAALRFLLRILPFLNHHKATHAVDVP